MVLLKISINNMNINYIVKGNSESKILILHGWGSSIAVFSHMINHLANNHTVYAVDMPGFGLSDEPPFAWNVDNYKDFVASFIQEMKLPKLSIIGHSFGGRVIIKLANQKKIPFVIEKLVLIDSAGIKPKTNKKSSLKVKLFKFAKRTLSIKFVKKVFPTALENLKKRFGSADYRNASPLMRDVLVRTVNEDLKPLLVNIKQPCLLVWGELDDATPLSDARIMEKLIPDAGIVTIKGAGHYSFLEQPGIVNSVLDSFLGGKK